MFTGIVTDVGSIRSIEGEGDIRASIETSYNMDTVDIGASIACAGVCLTVVDKGMGWFSADVSGETLSVTNLSSWKKGVLVNLERSLKLGDELGGHIVTGHVDCIGDLIQYETIDESIKMTIRVDSNMGAHVAKKGSVTINGVSLTVNSVDDREDGTIFSINIIPHTQEVTSFRNAQVGDFVNVEFDILARYVARLQEKG